MDKWLRREKDGLLRRIAPGQIAFIFAFLVAAGAFYIAVWKIDNDRREVFASAYAELLSGQNLLAAQFTRAIDAAVLTLNAADRWMSDQNHTGDIANELAALDDFINSVTQNQSFPIPVRVFDADANSILLPSWPGPGFSVADREYITDLDGKDYDFFKIGYQTRSRGNGLDLIPVVKLARPNKFGVKYIVAAIRIADLNVLFERVFVSAPGFVGAFREDGHLIFRNPDPEGYLGINLDPEYFMGPEAQRNDLGVILNRNDPDGRPLTIAYKHIERHPVFVYASFRNADLEQRSAARWPVYSGFATFVGLLSFAMAALISYFAHIREREAAALRAALITADAANIAKRDFLANVSHELRTPLNAIIGFSEMIGTGIFGKLTEKKRRVQRRRRHGGKAFADGCRSIARYRGDRGRPRAAAAGRVGFDDIAHMLAAKAASRNVAIDAIARDGRRILYADKRVLRQILLNLIDNAIKHSQPNGRVRVGWRESAPGRISIFVADQGVGIAPDELPHIFEPFWRSSDAYIARPDGVGLGLMVTKQLVAQSGGTISVESALGRGSEFAIDIPDTAVPIAAVPSRAA